MKTYLFDDEKRAAVLLALKELEENKGKEFFTKDYDRAMWVIHRLETAGFKVVRKRTK